MKTIHTTNPVTAAAEHLARAIKEHLSRDEHVLWLLSGGSGISVVLETAHLLSATDLTNLSVTLSDERYGPVGHANENWQQLLDNQLNLPNATLYRPLNGDDREVTTNKFGKWIDNEMTKSDYAIGLFGIGSDGHTAGIKPNSEAATSLARAAHFTGSDFERITITPTTISQLDEAVIQASGVDKVPSLKSLLHDTIAVTQQPAQVLKSVQQCTLYTDNEEL